MEVHYNLHCGRSCSGGDGVVVVLTCSCVSVLLVSYCVEVGGDTCMYLCMCIIDERWWWSWCVCVCFCAYA